MAWISHHYADTAQRDAGVVAALQTAISAALAQRKRAWLALAGGQTPLPIYQALAARDLDWSRVDAIATDERCVPWQHPASNLRSLQAAFAAAHGITLLALQDSAGLADATVALQRLQARPEPFDAVVLGMGGDGHTASLFPGAAALPLGLSDEAPAALLLQPEPLPPEAPFTRITLSAARLRHARALLLVVAGEAKRKVLEQAQQEPDPTRWPIAALLHDPATSLHIHWSP